MNHRNNFTGQRVDSRDHNDNAPARYSAPSAKFKEMLLGYANPFCRNCSGTGYLGKYKHVCAGRCFKCIPEEIMTLAKVHSTKPARQELALMKWLRSIWPSVATAGLVRPISATACGSRLTGKHTMWPIAGDRMAKGGVPLVDQHA